MTDREKAIVMAYTGTRMLAGDKLGIYYQYIQEKLGHCVMTHELAYPEVQDAIREATKDDFIELCRANDEPRVMTLDEVVSAEMVWLDWRTRGIRPAKVIRVPQKTGTYRIQRFGDIDEWNHADEYGEYWRCWTSRPTDEQREAALWND